MVIFISRQNLENFKRALLPEIEANLLGINDIDTAIEEMRIPILLFESDLPQYMSLSMLTCITDRKEDSTCKG